MKIIASVHVITVSLRSNAANQVCIVCCVGNSFRLYTFSRFLCRIIVSPDLCSYEFLRVAKEKRLVKWRCTSHDHLIVSFFTDRLPAKESSLCFWALGDLS